MACTHPITALADDDLGRLDFVNEPDYHPLARVCVECGAVLAPKEEE